MVEYEDLTTVLPPEECIRATLSRRRTGEE